MTNKEAIKIIEELWGVDYRYCLGSREVEAVDMAIQALKYADDDDHEYSYFPYQCRQQPEVNYEHLEHTGSERGNY